MMLPKLGKLEAKMDGRNLRAENYFAGLPSAPAVRDWGLGLPFDRRLWCNDWLGCCVAASIANLITSMAARAGVRVFITDEDVKEFYAEISGWDGRPETDNGAYLLDGCKRLRNVGLGQYEDGRPIKCEAFVSVNFFNPTHFGAAIDSYGGVVVGERLPVEVQGRDTWLVMPGMRPGSWGGHASARWGVSPTLHNGKSWDGPIYEEPDFLYTCGDEAYAFLIPELAPPSGLDLESLRADLQALR